MRSAQEMLDLILETAVNDDRIRAVLMTGSRTSPDASRDIFQDFDITYLVTDVASFRQDSAWIDRFGERIILQMPEAMQDPPPEDDGHFAYLMQFADGNRLDLTLFPLDRLAAYERESLTTLLLDKDGRFEPFPPPDESDFLPHPPTAKAFADCCNEFWWVSTYVAKGLWREEIIYAHTLLDQVVREQLMKMLAWHIGIRTDFSRSQGKFGKYYQRYLEPELWDMLLQTYADADVDHTWDALETMCRLFRIATRSVAARFGFAYPEEDERVTAHLKHVRQLPKTAVAIYPDA